MHNAHMYYVLLPDESTRDRSSSSSPPQGVHSVFHYVPLHSSEAGRRYGRASGTLDVTDDVSARLARLPLWVGMNDDVVQTVIEAVATAAGG